MPKKHHQSNKDVIMLCSLFEDIKINYNKLIGRDANAITKVHI